MVENTNNIPQWEKDTNDLKKKMDGTLYVQVAWISNQDHPCKPILLSFAMTHNYLPIVVEEPTGLQNPIYDWINKKWRERDTSALSEQLTDVKKQVESLNNEVQSNKESLKNNEELIKDVNNLQKGQANITTVLGQLLPAVQELSAFAKTLQSTSKEGE